MVCYGIYGDVIYFRWFSFVDVYGFSSWYGSGLSGIELVVDCIINC